MHRANAGPQRVGPDLRGYYIGICGSPGSARYVVILTRW